MKGSSKEKIMTFERSRHSNRDNTSTLSTTELERQFGSMTEDALFQQLYHFKSIKHPSVDTFERIAFIKKKLLYLRRRNNNMYDDE